MQKTENLRLKAVFSLWKKTAVQSWLSHWQAGEHRQSHLAALGLGDNVCKEQVHSIYWLATRLKSPSEDLKDAEAAPGELGILRRQDLVEWNRRTCRSWWKPEHRASILSGEATPDGVWEGNWQACSWVTSLCFFGTQGSGSQRRSVKLVLLVSWLGEAPALLSGVLFVYGEWSQVPVGDLQGIGKGGVCSPSFR